MNRWLLLVVLSLVQPGVAISQIDLQLTRVTDLTNVVDIKHPGDGSGRLFLVRQSGTVHVVEGGQVLAEPFIDVSPQVSFSGSEKGLLSMAFSPSYASNGEFYLYFTDTESQSNITRFRASQNENLADPDSGEEVFTVFQPFSNHNGGRLEFGPDGLLYLGIGDGGGAGDPVMAGQSLLTHLGKIIRIDVESGSATYTIPPDNPFVGVAGLNEIWAYGLRNPWRMSFDSMTGDLFIADVGQNAIEEIDFQASDAGGGQNYGWNQFEGDGCFEAPCDPSGKTFPVFQFSHAGGHCSVTGGQVYRGADYPNLFGQYLFGDFCSGQIWALAREGDLWVDQVLTTSAGGSILTFGEDQRGDIFISMIGSAEFSGVFLLSDGPPVIESGQSINAGMAGAWFDSTTPGQGFLIDVEPVTGFIFLAWFTFDEASVKLGAAEQRWLTAQGTYSGSSADFELSSTSGGVFDDPQSTSTATVGTLSIQFDSCSQARVDYDLPDDGLQGSIPLSRLVPGSDALCSMLASGR